MSTAAENSSPDEVPVATSSADEAAYYASLRDAGLIEELNESLLMELRELARAIGDSVRPGSPVTSKDPSSSERIDVLRRYYAADGDHETSSRRMREDRFLFHRDGDNVNAHGIVARLSRVVPELGEIMLERIGDEEGPLVIRAGERLSAVTDEADDEAAPEVAANTVSVRALVGAMNGLLANGDQAYRFVMLLADGWREIYVAVEPDQALALLHAGLLEHDSEEWLVEFCAF